VERLARRGGAILFGTAGVVFVLDRISKAWAHRMFADSPFDLIPGVVTLRYTTNSGGAFSLGQRAPWFFATATVIVAGLIVATAFRPRSTIAALSLGLILGGALGNLADRITHGPGFSGRVVDFIDLHVWPVFNLADSAIVIGAVMLAVSSMGAGKGGAPEPDDP